jgi:hypothetical protein
MWYNNAVLLDSGCPVHINVTFWYQCLGFSSIRGIYTSMQPQCHILVSMFYFTDNEYPILGIYWSMSTPMSHFGINAWESRHQCDQCFISLAMYIQYAGYTGQCQPQCHILVSMSGNLVLNVINVLLHWQCISNTRNIQVNVNPNVSRLSQCHPHWGPMSLTLGPNVTHIGHISVTLERSS